MRAALYLRVSTDAQTVENQEIALREAANRMGHEVVKVYTDQGISGAKGRDKRPGLDALLKDSARRKHDAILVWSVDRVGRSLQHLIEILSELHALKIDLHFHVQGIDTTTPAGKAMFQILGVFAEWERSMIRERVLSGMRRAKAQGKRIGRPPMDPAKREAIVAALQAPGRPGVRVIAREHGVSPVTVQSISRSLRT